MTVTKITIGVGVLVFGLLCWMAVDGITFAAVLLITIGALVVLVGGGNWIGGRSSAGRSRQPSGAGPPSSTYVPPAGARPARPATPDPGHEPPQ